jgi:hypothetical protein
VMLMLLLSARLLWIYLRWAPYMCDWVNHVRAGMYSAVVCVALMAVVLVFGSSGHPTDAATQAHNKNMTKILWIVLGRCRLQCVLALAWTCPRM